MSSRRGEEEEGPTDEGPGLVGWTPARQNSETSTRTARQMETKQTPARALQRYCSFLRLAISSATSTMVRHSCSWVHVGCVFINRLLHPHFHSDPVIACGLRLKYASLFHSTRLSTSLAFQIQCHRHRGITVILLLVRRRNSKLGIPALVDAHRRIPYYLWPMI